MSWKILISHTGPDISPHNHSVGTKMICPSCDQNVVPSTECNACEGTGLDLEDLESNYPDDVVECNFCNGIGQIPSSYPNYDDYKQTEPYTGSCSHSLIPLTKTFESFKEKIKNELKNIRIFNRDEKISDIISEYHMQHGEDSHHPTHCDEGMCPILYSINEAHQKYTHDPEFCLINDCEDVTKKHENNDHRFCSPDYCAAVNASHYSKQHDLCNPKICDVLSNRIRTLETLKTSLEDT